MHATFSCPTKNWNLLVEWVSTDVLRFSNCQLTMEYFLTRAPSEPPSKMEAQTTRKNPHLSHNSPQVWKNSMYVDDGVHMFAHMVSTIPLSIKNEVREILSAKWPHCCHQCSSVLWCNSVLSGTGSRTEHAGLWCTTCQVLPQVWRSSSRPGCQDPQRKCADL